MSVPSLTCMVLSKSLLFLGGEGVRNKKKKPWGVSAASGAAVHYRNASCATVLIGSGWLNSTRLGSVRPRPRLALIICLVHMMAKRIPKSLMVRRMVKRGWPRLRMASVA